MSVRIKHVYGNTLKVAIPLTMKIRELIDGHEVEREEDFYPNPSFPVIIDLKKGGCLHSKYEATVVGNVATFVDYGKIPIGLYNVEVICRDENEEQCRYKVSAVIEIVDNTIDADIEEGVEFNSETYTLEGTVYYYAKGDKGEPLTYEDLTEAQIEELQKPARDAATEISEDYNTNVKGDYADLKIDYATNVKDDYANVKQDAQASTGAANDAADLANAKATLADEKATEAGRVNATINGTTLTVTDRNGQSTSVDTKGDPGTTDYNELENKPDLSIYQEKENGKGLSENDYSDSEKALVHSALQSETDPTVPQWAKQPQKPTYTAQEVGALPNSTKYGSTIDLAMDSATYVLTLSLKDQDGTVLNTKTVDLPIESVVVNGRYDAANKKIVLTLQSGSTIDVPVGDLIAGLQTEITSVNMLDADLVDDTNSTHKFVTEQEKQTWNNKSDFSGSYNDLTDTPTIPTTLSQLSEDSTHRTVSDTEKTTWGNKQETLVSGTNIKTINNESLLGSGNINIVTDISGKADKVSGATNGHLAGLDSNGNLTDSGIAPEDIPEFVDEETSAEELADEYATLRTDIYQALEDAQQATSDATDAASLANTKAGLANSAATSANSAADNANDKATLANTKAGYAQGQGDYAKQQGDYAKEQADACASLDLVEFVEDNTDTNPFE